MPSERKAIVIQSKGQAVVGSAPYPSLRPDYAIVKVKAVALNPTDWKHVDWICDAGSIIGCDYAGVVEEVHPGATRFKKGDRICGFVHGGNISNHEDGGFAEYAAVKADIQLAIPDSMTYTEAATLGVGTATVGQALYQALEIPSPGNPAPTGSAIFIYGGSSATGTLAIQFAKLSGFEVHTTCSPHNFELCKSLGAVGTYDYNSPSAPSEIRAATGDKLVYAFDTISTKETASFCAGALASKAPEGQKLQYVNLLMLTASDFPRSDVEIKATLGYTAAGEAFDKFGRHFDAKPQDFEHAKSWAKIVQHLLNQGKIKVHPPDVRTGGFQGILEGMQEMREGKVSGKKLVYEL